MPSERRKRSRPRVLLLAPALSGGGSERVVAHLANRLDRERFDVVLGLGRRRGPMLAALEPHVRVWEVRGRQLLKAAVLLARHLKAHPPEVMLTTLSFGLPAALARRLADSPAKLLVRESNVPSQSWQNLARHSRLRAAWMRWTKHQGYRGADTVICQSGEMRRDIAAHFPDVAHKLHCISNPVDVRRVRELAETAPADWPRGEGRQLIAVGRLAWQKGYDLLLPALRRALDVHPDVHLTILGKGREAAAELPALAKRLGVADRVHLLGFQANPYAYMARADALVLTSRYEGLPNVVLEAHALGLPVIATDCPGGTAELVEPGVNGWLCPVEPQAIAATLIQSLAQLDTLNPDHIRARAEQRHDMPHIMKLYEDLIQQTLMHQE